MALAVVQTSTATVSHLGPFKHGHRVSRQVEATGITFEVAVHGETLASLRRVAKANHFDLAQAILAAVDDFIATNGNQHLQESPLVALLEQEGLQ